jgi:hypothetical protein
MWFTWLLVDACVVVPQRFGLLESHSGQVVNTGVDWGAWWWPTEAFVDGRPITPPRKLFQVTVQGEMDTKIHFFVVKLNYAWPIMNLLFFQSWAHGDSECSEVMGWILSRKGKGTASETTYNPDDPQEVYSNPSIHSRINAYTETDDRSMDQSGIWSVRRLMERRSWRWVMERSMAITTWVIAFWTQPLLPLSQC